MEIECSQIEKVQDQYQLSDPEAGIDPKQHKSGLENIIQNKVAAGICCCIGPVCVCREEMPNVARLEHQQDDPIVVLVVSLIFPRGPFEALTSKCL